MTHPLFNPCKVGAHTLSHRIVLAPLTRVRATLDTLAPHALNVQYYCQRASAGGLLITEATAISPEGLVVWTIYPAVRASGGHAPGIWTDEQTSGWSKVVQAVHAEGGYISCQLFHAGRVAQPDLTEHPLVKNSNLPMPSVSSSAVAMPSGGDGDYAHQHETAQPRALRRDEIARVCQDYQHAARNALHAGFDFVELHAAHGYLVDQFLCDEVNQRTDEYGNSLANRCRFLFEVVAALVEVAGPGRVGVRLSPTALDETTNEPNQVYFGATCSDPQQVYAHAISGLNDFPLAYLLLTEPRVGGMSNDPEQEKAYARPLANNYYRDLYHGTLIAAGGFTPNSAVDAVANGTFDLIAFGRWFIANPDLPTRIRDGKPLNVYDRSTFYSNAAKGYTDYPYWHELKDGMAHPYRLMEQSHIGVSLKDSLG